MNKINRVLKSSIWGVACVANLAYSTPVVEPRPLVHLDDFYSHHVLIAEKSTHLLHLYKNNQGKAELIKSYPMVTGKNTGDKGSEGDSKTPEGVYNFTNFMNRDQLKQNTGKDYIIYGAGAFTTDYPNPIDQRIGKTGSGIWLHSTNDESRIDKGLDSKGCVVTGNQDLIDVSKYIELNKTPIIIVQDLIYLNEKAHQATYESIKKTLEDWASAWKNKDIEKYMSFYHPTEFKDQKGNYHQYKAYKKAVFSNPGEYRIEVEHISIFHATNYVMVTFTQKYQSKTINDTGKKILYLKQDNSYNYKIVSEIWTKNGLELDSNHVAFEPQLRFFKENEVHASSGDKATNKIE